MEIFTSVSYFKFLIIIISQHYNCKLHSCELKAIWLTQLNVLTRK